jgi:hypothetical protein
VKAGVKRKRTDADLTTIAESRAIVVVVVVVNASVADILVFPASAFRKV